MKFIIILIMAVAAVHFSQGQTGRMIDQIKEHKTGTAVWWIGQNSWIIKADDKVIATDLYLEGERISPVPITAAELAEVVDVYFVTHDHGDHFGRATARVLAENSSCRFVLPESCLKTARELQVPEDRIVVAKPREPFTIEGIRVNPLRAIHGNENFAIYYDANLQDCGYCFDVNGIRFLQPGDSYLLEDHLFLEGVDVLFFSPTEHNMHINPSVILINKLNPGHIFPQHHSTMKVNDKNRFWAKGYPEEVKILLSEPMKENYHILRIGESMKLRD